MKQLIIMVSLILFGLFPLIKDNQREKSNPTDNSKSLSLTCPDYLPQKNDINLTSDFIKPFKEAGEAGIDRNSEALNNIRLEEYSIKYSEKARAFQSSNRANNINFTYESNGFTAETRQTTIPLFDVNDLTLNENEKKYKHAEDWSVELIIESEKLNAESGEMHVSGNNAWTENDKIRIDYTNTAEGMRQDFIVKEKLTGKDGLQLLINVKTNLKIIVSNDAVTFSSKTDGTDRMKYTALKVTDADGKILDAYFEKKNPVQFAIVVDDRDAVYPVTVDPLALNSDWEVVCDQRWSRYGDGITSGDINGDGYDDVAVGAPAYEPGGAVFIYFGSATGPSLHADRILYGTGIGFGNRINCNGDINNDNFCDLIIGDPFIGGGIVWIYYGSPTGVSDSVKSQLQSISGMNFGYSVSNADVNDDGYSDVIAGYQAEADNRQIGALVYLGSASGINVQPAWTASVPAGTNYVGFFWAVSSAGDITNDGFQDIIVGTFSGYALIYFGADNKGMYESADIILSQPDNYFGYSVSSAGDINSDGFDDVAIGASYSAFLYYGTQNGLNINFSFLNNGAYHTSSAGDFNDDGYGDLITTDFGSGIYLYFGSSSGIKSSSYVFVDRATNISNGDINGDGITDIIGATEPRAFGFYGSADKVNTFYLTPEDTVLEPYPGTEICLTAVVRSQYDLPMSGVNINYSIHGNNSGSGTSVSDSNGIAKICYLCNSTMTIGIDTITASAADKTDTAYVFWDLPMPVELSTFTSTVSGRDVTLNWSTTSELNNSGFDIERYSTENLWVKAGFVKGHGTVSHTVSYSFTDNNLSTGVYKYRLKQTDFNGNFEYFELAGEVSIGIPDKYELSQNYPNPFNPVTNLEFGISKPGYVSIKIYDDLGRELVALVNEFKEPGYYNVKFDAGNLSSGTYFYRMTAGDFAAVKKFVVLK